MATAQKTKPKVDRTPLARPGDQVPTPRPRDDDKEPEPLARISSLRPVRPALILELENEGAHRVELELLSKLPIAKQQAVLRASNEYDSLMEQDFEVMAPADREASETRLKQLLDYQFERVMVKPDGMSERDWKRIKAAVDDYGRGQVVRAFMLAPLQLMLAEQAKLSEPSQNGSSESLTSET